MLLGEKTKLGEAQLTVLPETYKQQQAQLSIVLGKLIVPKLVSYKSIFHSLDPHEHAIAQQVHV